MLLDISDIRLGQRLRPVNDAIVAALVPSLADKGLQKPIVVAKGVEHRTNNSDLPTFTLVAGLQRLTAGTRLGWSRISAEIIREDDLVRHLAEIDENLLHGQLTELERSEHLRTRRIYYVRLYPNAVHHGGDRKSGRFIRGDRLAGFNTDTVKKIGISDRAGIWRAIRRAEDIDPRVKEIIAKYPRVANNQAELDRLVEMPSTRQRKVAELLTAGKVTSVRGALRL